MAENKSTLLRGMTRDGSARILVMDSRAMVNGMIAAHHTAPTASAALGRLLTAASMIGSLLPEAGNTLTLNVAGDGAAGRLLAVADYCGDVKGYIQNPAVDPPRRPDGKLDVGTAVGQGTLSVIRQVGGDDPQVGTVPLVSGEIAEDLASYFANSEQIPTLLSLGVLIDTDHTCRAAGGVLIQLMPFPDEETVDRLEQNAAALSHISSLFADGMSCEKVAELALAGIPYDLFDTLQPAYRCDCSRERMLEKLRTLKREEICSLLDEQQAEGKPRELEAVCRFCQTGYTYTEDELLGSGEA